MGGLGGVSVGMCTVIGRSIKSRGMRPYSEYKMVLSRGLRDEVKTAFWGRAVDRQVVGLARGLAHHPTPACLQQFPSPSSAVRICSTLDKQTAVTEGQKDENPDFCFILASAAFHETPRLGQIGTAQSTLTGSKTFGTQNIELPHPGLSPCVTSRWFLRTLGRSPRSRNQLAGARHSWRIGRTVSRSHVDRGISMFILTAPQTHSSPNPRQHLGLVGRLFTGDSMLGRPPESRPRR